MKLGIGLGLTSVAAMGGRRWSPASLSPLFWAGGFDPASGRMWQDSAGTTPVTAAGQPVGLVLDKSQGAVPGPELVANGDFSNGTADWLSANGATPLIVSVAMRVTNGLASSGYVRQIVPTVVGELYEFRGEILGGTAADPNIRLGTTLGASQYSAAAPSLFHFIATGTELHISLRTNETTIGVYADFDNISVREIPGNHALQPTALSRPTLRQSGAVWYLEDDGGDSLPAVFPAGNLHLAYVNQLGEVSYSTDTSDGTTGVDLLLAERMADVIVLDRAFTPDEEAKIEAYWARYAA